MDAKFPLVDFLRPCRFVCEQLAVKRSLGQSVTHDRHCATVGFKEKMHALFYGEVVPEQKGTAAPSANAQERELPHEDEFKEADY